MKSRKKLTAVALATVMALSYVDYPVYAQEETEIGQQTETEQDNNTSDKVPTLEDTELEDNEKNVTLRNDIQGSVSTTEEPTSGAQNGIQLYEDNNAGSFNVTGGTAGTDWTYDSDANTLTFNNSGTYTITGDGQVTDERIIFESSTYDITIENLSITNTTESPIVVKQNAGVNLTLDGQNVLVATADRRAALSVPQTASLIITEQSSGSLEAMSSGQYSSGIGGDRTSGNGSGQITINGGTIKVVGGREGAGIGGGCWSDAGKITINGGTITATGGSSAAGIGGSVGASTVEVEINNGTVQAFGGAGMSGIGGDGSGTITINGGTVTATSGEGWGAPGIGDKGQQYKINIKGGTVIAQASGSESTHGIRGDSVTIKDANVTTTGSYYSAGILAYTITVSSGKVVATGGANSAGISGNVTIYGGDVQAIGNTSQGTARSRGGHGIDGKVVIYGGVLEARGGDATSTSYYGGSGINGAVVVIGGVCEVKGGDAKSEYSYASSGIVGNTTVNGGTLTAIGGTEDSGDKKKFGIDGQGSIVISNGSVKASSVSVTPTDGCGNNVYLAKIDGLSGVDSVTVDNNQTFTRAGNHPDGDGAFYLYLTGYNHTITANGKTYCAHWDSNISAFKYDNIVPTVTIASKTATSITVQPLADTNTYGDAEYSINNTDWQTRNVFTGLNADTQYTVYARYKGNDTYIQSEAGSTTVNTKRYGNTLIVEPTSLTATYGQKLSDISLDDEWTWVNGDIDLSVGKQNYSARFGTTSYEDEYDFTGVEGYDSTNQYVERSLAVDVSKADTKLVIKTDNMDKAYDSQAVSEPEVDKTGSTNTVTFTWYKKDGSGWTTLDKAPVNAGNYKVTASVEADANYKGATAEKEFAISQTTNDWTSPLSITGWTYGQIASTPTATAQYGDVVFTYSDSKDGTFSTDVPTTAGTWYVKATVTGNADYTGLEAVKEFTIGKAMPVYTIPDDLTIRWGEKLSSVTLPKGFSWVDGEQIAEELGEQTFSAIFTPTDTENYQIVEVSIPVWVEMPSTTIYYALHFDANGGERISSIVRESGTVIDLSEYVSVREGYIFTGWYEDDALTRPVTEVTLDNTKTIHAGWKEIETDTRRQQEIFMAVEAQERDLKNGSRNTMSKVCTLKLGFAVDDPDLSLSYETSDPEVATVEDGKITYQGVGTCTVTVTAAETEMCKATSLAITVKVGSLGTPTFTPSVTSRTAQKAFVVTSSTVRGVDGYEVQYSIRDDFWRATTKDFPDTGAKLYRETCTTVHSNMTYYIHVRGYQIIGGEKVYSDWSPVKTIRTK